MRIFNKRILVTCGVGFIGSHLCQRLLSEGAEVLVLDDLSAGKSNNLEAGIKATPEWLISHVKRRK